MGQIELFPKQTKKTTTALTTGSSFGKLARMTESRPPDLLNNLERLGRAIDIGRPLFVCDGGRVGFNDVDDAKENDNAKQQRSRGPSSRSRQGQRTRSWSERGRPTGSGNALRSGRARELYGADARSLIEHYNAQISEAEGGIWAAIECRPLGRRGPECHFLIALPFNQRIMPRALSFAKVGRGARPLGLRHTNFPDASVCAFARDERAWHYEDGAVALVDIFSLWALRQLHFKTFGWWPGPQLGQGAFYRRAELRAEEFCGCASGKRYRECHLASDILISDESGRAEFYSLFKCHYEERSIPKPILQSARSGWNSWPNMRTAYSYRPIDEV
jgi:hypothetical protein